MDAGVEEVGRRYRDYLDARQAGGPRQYFGSTAHALYFLKGVAPTKLVDGAWLYGLLSRWQDPRFLALVQTYLEELGEGLPAKNHVVLFKKLLATQGIANWEDLSDEHFVQGAIQLALAYGADQFLPEIIGFNLGYEQLPLHLLICAYELKELGIDPYYFTLHITVDNADSGHAKKAVDAIFEATPRLGDPDEFYRRVRNGYMLNFLGAGTNAVIGEFDLESEVRTILGRKSSVGQYAHSDYRRIEGSTVNQWLTDPAQSGDFLAAMEREGWFTRGQDPQQSRFWKLIQSDKAKMFGVFSPYEQQVIFDWMLGDAASDPKAPRLARRALTFEAKMRALDAPNRESVRGATERILGELAGPTDFDAEARALQNELEAAPNREEAAALLIAWMSPARHHCAPGLAATRLFNEMVG